MDEEENEGGKHCPNEAVIPTGEWFQKKGEEEERNKIGRASCRERV